MKQTSAKKTETSTLTLKFQFGDVGETWPGGNTLLSDADGSIYLGNVASAWGDDEIPRAEVNDLERVTTTKACKWYVRGLNYGNGYATGNVAVLCARAAKELRAKIQRN